MSEKREERRQLLCEDENSRAIAFWEIVSVTSSALIAEWAVVALVGMNKILLLAPVVFALALMIFSHRARGETLPMIGWRIDNFPKAIKELAPFVLLATMALILIGQIWSRYDANYLISDKWWRGGAVATLWLFARVSVWGLFQEYVLQGFVNRRAQIVFGKNWRSLLVVGSVFAILHLPNLPLAVATFFAGIIFGRIYQRAPNLFALALAHCVLTIALVSTLPTSALHDLRVGYKVFG